MTEWPSEVWFAMTIVAGVSFVIGQICGGLAVLTARRRR